jgi:hypothetical protein
VTFTTIIGKGAETIQTTQIKDVNLTEKNLLDFENNGAES